MELVTAAPAGARAVTQRISLRLDAPALAAWSVAFSTVTYLALKDGGYDTIVRSDVGVAVWWVVLLSALAGILPARIGSAGWVAIGLLGGFAIWTGITIGWSENAESSLVELGRLAAYLGVLVLAVALQGHTAARHTINGLASAIGLVTVLAVLSRLHPQAFPPNAHFQFLGPESARKLSYPLNYWNGLAVFAAMGAPLLLAIAVGGRTLVGRAIASATLPVIAVCLYLTVSRGGVVYLGVGLVVFLVAAPRRLEATATLVVAAAASAILVSATSKRGAVTAGAPTAAQIHQGTQLIWLAVIVCLGVGLIQIAISLAAQHVERSAWLAPGRRATAKVGLALVVVVILGALVAGGPSKLSHAWHDFKQPTGVVVPGNQATVFSRLQVANGNGRYQLWQAAWHAAEAHPWTGIGPGTFQFWWARHATVGGPVRNAHSLYLETLAETGIIGAALLGGLLVWFAGVGVRRLIRRSPGTPQLWIAAAAAGLAAFLAGAAFEWVWQLAAIAAIALMLGAVLVAGGTDATGPGLRWAGARPAPRIVLSLLAIAGLAAIVDPLAEAVAVQNSQAAAAQGNLPAAYADSLVAQRLEPYAETPRLQQALVLEAAGDLGPAASAARAATARGATDWSAWLTLARIDARRGATAQALAALREAQALNPLSTLLEQQ